MFRSRSRVLLTMARTKQTARMSTGPPPAKVPRPAPNSIGTHSGSFHCDEALGCYLLKQLSDFSSAKIVRSRDPEVLKDCTVVLDVGGIYDPEQQRFDHHQKGFLEYFPGFQTKLSSAGLIYKHYGKQVVAGLMEESEDEPNVQTVYIAAYKNFMEAIDAIDNGINQWEGSQTPKYISNTNLSSRVGRLNPDWNEECDDGDLDAKFQEAMELAGTEFEEQVNWLSEVWLPARTVVEDAIKKAKETDSSGEIIVLESGCPWKEHLYDLEKELGVEKPLKYVVYGDKDSYRVQAVGYPGSFESRKALPAEWRGLRDEQLSQVSGISDCVFVHASGFIGGNKSFEGAAAMARTALTMP